ncbi:protein Shroom4-like [Hibiscus syriacus]|uniref:Protein Shroom4-like n=1 Tax=Hibiscus syriacus TaxID=106335 RepID=A0A6A2XM50_HIBSY|nr:protein Shroom4-like [Hibiscus syriacus]
MLVLYLNRRGFSSINDVDTESETDTESYGFRLDLKEVERVCKVIDELFCLDRNMEADLDECGIDLTHDLIIDVLERYRHARKPAFRFFCCAGQKPGFEHDSSTYNKMMNILAKNRQFETMLSMLEEMGARGALTMDTFIIAIKAFAALKERKKAVGIFDLMKKYKYKAGVDIVNCLLERLLRSRKTSDAVKLFEVMKTKGLLPNVRSYTIMIRECCKQAKMGEAVQYFEEMHDSGCPPDVAVYTCFITGFGNQRRMDMAYRLLKEMQDKGCPPDGHTYNALIKLLTTQRMPDDAMRVYKKMIQAGVQPTIHTFNMMMKSFFQSRNYDMSCAIWEEMTEKGFCPDDVSYTVFIGGLIHLGRSGEACRLLEEMIEKGMKAPQLDYDRFAADFSRAGKPAILEKLARKMKLSGKIEASNIFTRRAKTMKKRVKRKGSFKTYGRCI